MVVGGYNYGVFGQNCILSSRKEEAERLYDFLDLGGERMGIFILKQ